MPKLAIAVSGAGDVEFEGQADALTLKMTGAGDVELDGEDGAIATSLAVESTGSGKVNAGEFKAKTVDLKLAGSGDASVFATEAVTVAASGSGDVDIKGNPATRNVDAKVRGRAVLWRGQNLNRDQHLTSSPFDHSPPTKHTGLGRGHV